MMAATTTLVAAQVESRLQRMEDGTVAMPVTFTVILNGDALHDLALASLVSATQYYRG